MGTVDENRRLIQTVLASRIGAQELLVDVWIGAWPCKSLLIYLALLALRCSGAQSL